LKPDPLYQRKIFTT